MVLTAKTVPHKLEQGGSTRQIITIGVSANQGKLKFRKTFTVKGRACLPWVREQKTFGCKKRKEIRARALVTTNKITKVQFYVELTTADLLNLCVQTPSGKNKNDDLIA